PRVFGSWSRPALPVLHRPGFSNTVSVPHVPSRVTHSGTLGSVAGPKKSSSGYGGSETPERQHCDDHRLPDPFGVAIPGVPYEHAARNSSPSEERSWTTGRGSCFGLLRWESGSTL